MENLNLEQKTFIKTFVDAWMKNKVTMTIGGMESDDFQIDKIDEKYFLLTNTQETEPVAVLFDTIHILKLLEKNNLIYFAKIKRTPPPYEHQEKKYALEIIDENLIEYLDKNFDKSIIITQALLNFVSNDFRTGEQIRLEQQQKDDKYRFAKQLKITKNSFYLSFIGLLAAIIIPFCANTSFNQTQLDEIKQSIEILKMDFPAKINTVITNDTLKVNVIKFSTQQPTTKK